MTFKKSRHDPELNAKKDSKISQDQQIRRRKGTLGYIRLLVQSIPGFPSEPNTARSPLEKETGENALVSYCAQNQKHLAMRTTSKKSPPHQLWG